MKKEGKIRRLSEENTRILMKLRKKVTIVKGLKRNCNNFFRYFDNL